LLVLLLAQVLPNQYVSLMLKQVSLEMENEGGHFVMNRENIQSHQVAYAVDV
jgi:hypothetical protein